MRPAERNLLILLVVSIFINYIDRGNLSVAAPLLERELSLNSTQLGSLLASFFWTYALFQLFGIAGWLADRFDVALVFAGGFLVWSAATAGTGLVHTFSGLFVMRLVLGAGESLAYPCYCKMLARYFPEHHRGVANALLDAGSKMGPALGTLLGGYMVAALGWRIFLLVLGLGSMIWLLPWMLMRPRDTQTSVEGSAAMPSINQILTSRSAWGTFFGLFCANYYWFFLLTWLPTYLVRERHLSMQQMAVVGSFIYFAIAAATVVAGWFSDRWIRQGASVTRVRKTIVVSGLTFSTIILPVPIIDNNTAALLLLVAAAMGFGVFTSNHWAISQTLAGPVAAGRWVGLQNGVGNLAGVAAPWFTGVVVQSTGSFHFAFVTAAVIALAGALMYTFVVGRVEQVQFFPCAASKDVLA